jgi:hypothetical protein
MTLKIQMAPNPHNIGDNVSGIHSVIRAYARLLPEYGIHFAKQDESATLMVTHAGMGMIDSDIAMLHGIYFTADYRASKEEWRANKNVVGSIARAGVISVPSPWVAETLRRDFRLDPIIIPHGVFTEEWVHNETIKPRTILWAKNRYYDVCDPSPLNSIAEYLPEFTFFTTVAASPHPSNVVPIGVQDTENIKKWIQRVSMVMGTVKETWGIVYAEALAAGTPVITTSKGHVKNLVTHGVDGYVYNPSNPLDIEYGVRWIESNRSQLSANASKRAGLLDWKHSIPRVARLFYAAQAMRDSNRYI